MASISYGILVCNEAVELNRLLSNLTAYLRPEDEIVVLVDEANVTSDVRTVIRWWGSALNGQAVHFVWSNFNGNFAERRNELAALCTKDWIFQIDADELVSLKLVMQLPTFLENSERTAYALARINTVTGLTPEDVKKWDWHVNEHGWVNWPDWQVRLYKKESNWHWEGEVHERLLGGTEVQCLIEGLYHPKDIVRQRKQNALYDTYKH